MRKLLKWLGYFGLFLLALAVCGVAAVYAVSEYKLRRGYEKPPLDLRVPDDPAAISEGRRLARLRGCYMGCHRELEGGVLIDEPWLARLVAPNLTRAAARYSTGDLARIVRFGVRPDGSTTVGMPSDMFYFLSDADLARILAFIRDAEPAGSDLPGNRYRILGRVGIALGQFEPDAARVAALGPRPAVPEPGPTADYGRYLAMTACTECHGMRLEGGFGGQAPPLSIARSYSRTQFERLMRKGVPLDGRELNVMGKVAVYRFSVMTDEELEALYAFLQTASLPLEDGSRAEAVLEE